MKQRVNLSVSHRIMLDELIEKAREILPAGSQMSLFGSRSRGDAHADSDWDIHILIHGEEKINILDTIPYVSPLEDIGLNHNEIINVMIYSYKGWNKRHFLPFYKNVENEKIVLMQN